VAGALAGGAERGGRLAEDARGNGEDGLPVGLMVEAHHEVAGVFEELSLLERSGALDLGGRRGAGRR
jgi:hypothetical protein